MPTEEKSQAAREGGRGTGQEPPRRTAVDLLDQKPPAHRIIPVWFFVGVLLSIYGLIILATGISEFSNPPATVLSNLHPAIWWGVLLMAIGGIYVYLHWPRKA